MMMEISSMRRTRPKDEWSLYRYVSDVLFQNSTFIWLLKNWWAFQKKFINFENQPILVSHIVEYAFFLENFVGFQAEMPLDVDNVMSHTWKDVTTLPQWNPNINFASLIASPTDNFDVITVSLQNSKRLS